MKCLTDCTGLSAHNMGHFISDIYKQSSEYIHSRKTAKQYVDTSDKIIIDETYFSIKQCRAMECICVAFAFPCEIKLIKRNNIVED